MNTDRAPQAEHTREDFQRTQTKILDSYERGHGVELAPAEVERVVTMMQGMELTLTQERMSAQQLHKVLTAVLHAFSDDGKVEISGELLDVMVAGYNAHWDEETNVVTFEVVYPDEDEAVEGIVEDLIQEELDEGEAV